MRRDVSSAAKWSSVRDYTESLAAPEVVSGILPVAPAAEFLSSETLRLYLPACYWGIVERISVRFRVDWQREQQKTERLARPAWQV
ncbi:MAG: hypothetical protein ACRD1J_04375 [Terriglobia bacterium]